MKNYLKSNKRIFILIFIAVGLITIILCWIFCVSALPPFGGKWSMEDILKNRHVDSVSVSYVDEGGTPCNENKLYIYDSKQAESFILLFKGDSHGIPAFVTSMCRLMVEVELSSKEKLSFHLYFFGNNSTSSASIDFDPRLPSSKTIELRYGHADLSHKSAQNVYNYLQSTSPSREELELLRIEE